MQRTIRPHLLAVAIGHALAAMTFVRRIVDAREAETAPGYDASAEKAIAETSAALRDKGTDPDAAPMSGEAAVRYAPVQTCKNVECLRVFMRDAPTCPACGTSGMKPKRNRVRGRKLYACDLEPGGVYVPKRGNNKTPNFEIVRAFGRLEDGFASSVIARRVGEEGDGVSYSAEEFLALVARRVDA